MQWELAKKNVAMAIWLGKQYLGQREPEQALNVRSTSLDDDTLERMREDFAYEYDFGGEGETTYTE